MGIQDSGHPTYYGVLWRSVSLTIRNKPRLNLSHPYKNAICFEFVWAIYNPAGIEDLLELL